MCAFGALIKEPLLSEHEILNVHPSLLPRWRGAAPIERAIMAGDERTGVSIMRLTAGLDSGPVCLAGEEPIAPDDTYGSLARAPAGARRRAARARAARSRRPSASSPSEGVTYAEKIGPEDRLLDPARPAVELERVGARPAPAHRRAPGARGRQRCSACTARRAARARAETAPGAPAPGLHARDGRLLLRLRARACSSCSRCSRPGARRWTPAAYLRGHAAPERRR